MAKDSLDLGTLDAFPKKRGRPRKNPEGGLITSAEIMRRKRAGKVTVEFHLLPGHVDRLDKLRGDLSRDEWLASMLKQSRKPKA